MRLLIDGDACPSINLITETAKKENVEVIIYTDDSHIINNEYAKTIVVSTSFQSVDMNIIKDIEENDVLITQDYGLASLALGKKSIVLNPSGKRYTNENIDILLNQRYINMKLRNQKIKTTNPKKRKLQDDQNLINELLKIIKN